MFIKCNNIEIVLINQYIIFIFTIDTKLILLIFIYINNEITNIFIFFKLRVWITE